MRPGRNRYIERPPSAPAAGGLRNPIGNQAQPRPQITQAALRNKRPQQQGPTGGTKPQGPPGRNAGRQSPFQKQQQNKKQNQNRPKGGQAKPDPPPTPITSDQPVAPSPYQEGTKPDPRDENYYANKAAIEATYGVKVQGIQAAGERALGSYNQEGMALAYYNQQRQRSMGENRYGRGLRSGRHRQDLAEAQTDYLVNEARRQGDFADSEAQRTLDIGQLLAERDQAIRDLEIKTTEGLTDDMLDQSANSAGDAKPMEDPVPYPESGGSTSGASSPDPNARLRNKIKRQTARIQNMRERLAKTNDPNKRAQLERRIRAEQKRRSQTKGKLRG